MSGGTCIKILSLFFFVIPAFAGKESPSCPPVQAAIDSRAEGLALKRGLEAPESVAFGPAELAAADRIPLTKTRIDEIKERVRASGKMVKSSRPGELSRIGSMYPGETLDSIFLPGDELVAFDGKYYCKRVIARSHDGEPIFKVVNVPEDLYSVLREEAHLLAPPPKIDVDTELGLLTIRAKQLRRMSTTHDTRLTLGNTRFLHFSSSDALVTMTGRPPALLSSSERIKRGLPVLGETPGTSALNNSLSSEKVPMLDLNVYKGNRVQGTRALVQALGERAHLRMNTSIEAKYDFLHAVDELRGQLSQATVNPDRLGQTVKRMRAAIAQMKVVHPAFFRTQLYEVVDGELKALRRLVARNERLGFLNDDLLGLGELLRIDAPMRLSDFELKLARKPFRMVLGSTLQDLPGGAFAASSSVVGEVGVPAIELGKRGMNVIYVDPENIPAVKQWLASKGLDKEVSVRGIRDILAFQQIAK